MTHGPLPEPLGDFLQHPPNLPADADRKEMRFQQTAQMLPKSRRWRAPIVTAVAAGIVLAFVLSYAFMRGEKIDPVLLGKSLVERQPVPAGDNPRPIHEPEPPRGQMAAEPRELEWNAFDATNDQERVRLYFQAGDLYLTSDQDIDAALRCYRQALSYCAARELEFDPSDNWLVMALKNDRRKEH